VVFTMRPRYSAVFGSINAFRRLLSCASVPSSSRPRASSSQPGRPPRLQQAGVRHVRSTSVASLDRKQPSVYLFQGSRPSGMLALLAHTERVLIAVPPLSEARRHRAIKREFKHPAAIEPVVGHARPTTGCDAAISLSAAATPPWQSSVSPATTSDPCLVLVPALGLRLPPPKVLADGSQRLVLA